MRHPLLAGALLLASCGYRAMHAPGGREHFAVVLSASQIPDGVAADEVVAGVRDELTRLDAFAGGDAYPRCEIEVLRADEASEGIGAAANADGVELPDARATQVALVARAWIVRTKDGPRERDTGDVRAVTTVGVAPDARTGTFRHVDALRAVGRRVGRRVGLRVLGVPTASDE